MIVGSWPCQMSELSIVRSLKARTCGTTGCVWNGARSLRHPTGMFMRSHGLTSLLSFWRDRLVDLPMPCFSGALLNGGFT